MTSIRMDRVGVGYTLATGRLFCDIGVFHKYAEQLLARPVMTHEFADPTLWDEMRKRYESLIAEMGFGEPPRQTLGSCARAIRRTLSSQARWMDPALLRELDRLSTMDDIVVRDA